jgi:pilus assembly protein CpaC
VSLGRATAVRAQEPTSDKTSPRVDQQIQLDVVIAHVKPGVIPIFALRFLKQHFGEVYVGTIRKAQDHSAFLKYLQTLRNEGVVRLVASPCLVTISGRSASFLCGGERAMPVPPGLGQVGTQFEEFGTRVNFLPTVLGNGKIHLEVEPEVSTLEAANGTSINGTVIPGRITRRINITVGLKPGQTFVVYGMSQPIVEASTTKVPVLGSLPVVGSLFRSDSFEETKRELVILVTPHLVEAQTTPEKPK